MDLFHTDLTYFADRVPVVKDIGTIFFAVGWALLIGNLVFQAMRSMMSGVGIEAEEPGRLFLRTAMFSFLLVVSRQICEVGFGLSSTIMDMLQVPNAITFDPFGADTFDMLPNAGWIVVILVNVVIQWQTIKLFFEVAERYVILCVLTYCAPLAFAMGGSKSTAEIFRGWLRMFASMCALMVFNLVFVKLLISAMSNAPSGTAIIPWMMLVVGIVRMAKKMDGIILRIGLNPALTGDPLGTRFPGMLTAMTLRSIAQMVTRTAAQGAPFARHANTTGAPMSHNNVASGRSAGQAAGAAAQSGAAAGAAGAAGAAIHAAGSGARVMSDLTSFRNRRGAGDSAALRQIGQAISVDADDWEEGNSASSIRSQNQSAWEANAVSRLYISPVSPAIPPLSADFGRMEAPQGVPQIESGTRVQVMPTSNANTTLTTGLPAAPVPPAAAMPRTPDQVFPNRTSASATSQEAASGPHGTRPPVQPTAARQIHVTPAMPAAAQPTQTVLHSENNVSETHSGYTEQNTLEHSPVSPTEPINASSGIVPAAAMAAATAAKGHAAPAVQPNQTAPAGSTGLSVTPPSRTVPHTPPSRTMSQTSPIRQVVQQPIPGTDGGSIRVTPVVPYPQAATTTPASRQPVSKAAAQPTAQSAMRSTPQKAMQPAQQTSVQPTPPTMRAQVAPASAAHPVSPDSGRRTAAPPAASVADRRPAISPAQRERDTRREYHTRYQSTEEHSNVPPGIRTPDMVGRPKIADKTRRLRRSAQPLKNKVTPQKGGKRHKRRKKR